MSTTDTPTPRTDAQHDRLWSGKYNLVEVADQLVGFARGLERDLAQIKAELDAFKDSESAEIVKLRISRNEALDDLARAREEVDRLTKIIKDAVDEDNLLRADYRSALNRADSAEAQLTQSLATGERLREELDRAIEVGNKNAVGWAKEKRECNRLREASTTLLAVVGLTAFKHEAQRAVLQEAVDGMQQALAASPPAAPAAVHEDTKRLDWLVKHTEFRFRPFDPIKKTYLTESYAQGCVLRPVVDAAIEKYGNLDGKSALAAAPLPPTKAGENPNA